MNDATFVPTDAVSIVSDLVDEFTERVNRGEHPDIGEYVARCPELATMIRQVLGTLEMIRQTSEPGTGGLDGPICDDTVQRQLGDYRIIREIGRGGMGVVYEADQISLGRRVALKVLPFAATLDQKQLQRFKNEAQAAAHLHHTNIVPIHAVGCERGVQYYAMQFIEGRTLAEVIDELRRAEGRQFRDGSDDDGTAGVIRDRLAATLSMHGPISDAAALAASQPAVDRSCSFAASTPAAATLSTEGSTHSPGFFRTVAGLGVQAAQALEYAHSEGVVHRDIKPSNLILDNVGRLWVTDFGLARNESDRGLTMTGDLIGTLRYMSPEQALAKRVVLDHRTDIYSLGVTLYELLTLESAVTGTDRQELLRQIAFEEPKSPRRLNKSIPAELETIVLKAMEKNPAQRYSTAQDLADDLNRYLKDEPVRARRVSPLEHLWRWCRRNRLVTGLTASVVLLITVVGIGGAVANLLRTERDRARVNEGRAKQAEEVTNDALGRARAAEREVQIRSHLAQATAYRRSGQPGRRYKCLDELRQAVDRNPSDELRAALRDEAIASMALVDLRGLDGPVPAGTLGLAFDVSYRRYAFADEHTKIHVRNVGEPYDLSVLPGIGSITTWHSFSPGGQYLWACPPDRGPVQVWQVESGRPVFDTPLQGFGQPNFSSDESRVAISLLGGVGVYELSSGLELYRIATGTTPSSIALHPDNRRVAVVLGRSRVVQIWDVEQDSVVTQLPDMEGYVHCVTWDPEGRRLALGLAIPSRAEVWDVATRQRVATLEGHAQNVTGVQFHPSEDLIETWSHDGLTRVWDAHTARQLVAWPSGVAGSPSRDGRILGHTFRGSQIQLVEIITAPEYRTFASTLVAGEGTYYDGGLSADGRLMAGAMGDGVRLWDVASGRELAHLPIETTKVVSFSRDGRELITSGYDGLVRWPIEQDSASQTMRIGPPHVVPLPITDIHATFSLDGRTVGVSSVPSNKGMIVDLDGEAVTRTLEPHEMMTSLALTCDGQWAASYGWHSHSVKVWNARTGELVKEFELGNTAVARFSPDDKQLIISRYSDFSFYEVGSWQLVRTVPREFCPYPGHIAFSPDGSVMALELFPAVISLVDVATGRTLARLEDPHRDRSRWMDFTPDGTRLVVVSTYARAIHVWELGMIRDNLADLGLDWEPSLASSLDDGTQHEPPTIAVDLGDFGPKAEARQKARQARIQFDLAYACTQSKQWPEAIVAYQRAIELAPASDLYHNNYAWLLATCPDPQFRDESAASEHAQRAVELSSNVAESWNTLGVARYRAGNWLSAIDALSKAEDLKPGVYFGHNAFFIAMAHWQLDDHELARAWFDRAIAWMDKHRSVDEELRRFYADAAELMSVKEKKD
jgi:serine/threonine protein kinase/WD40 repeat protein